MEYAILAIAAFLAGILNTIAGGGTFLTFPALVYSGLPLISANATSAIAVFPGYLSGAVGFRKEISTFDRKKLLTVMVIAALGGLAGSLLLLVSSNKLFTSIVPFLLLVATLFFAYGSRLQDWAQRYSVRSVNGGVSTFLVSIYGGYFNGGLGVVLLALFSLWGMRDLNQMNGLKNILTFILSLVSAMAFTAMGIIAWPQALVMMGAATLGGYIGAPLARALPGAAVRMIVIFVGTSMSAVFFWRMLR